MHCLCRGNSKNCHYCRHAPISSTLAPWSTIKEKAGEHIVMKMHVLIFPSHTLKPCCARQTSKGAEEKQDKCSMTGSDSFTLYAAPANLQFLPFVSFLLSRRHIWRPTGPRASFHRLRTHSTSWANAEKHLRSDAHVPALRDTQQRASDHSAADGNLLAHQQTCLLSFAARPLSPCSFYCLGNTSPWK